MLNILHLGIFVSSSPGDGIGASEDQDVPRQLRPAEPTGGHGRQSRPEDGQWLRPPRQTVPAEDVRTLQRPRKVLPVWPLWPATRHYQPRWRRHWGRGLGVSVILPNNFKQFSSSINEGTGKLTKPVLNLFPTPRHPHDLSPFLPIILCKFPTFHCLNFVI